MKATEDDCGCRHAVIALRLRRSAAGALRLRRVAPPIFQDRIHVGGLPILRPIDARGEDGLGPQLSSAAVAFCSFLPPLLLLLLLLLFKPAVLRALLLRCFARSRLLCSEFLLDVRNMPHADALLAGLRALRDGGGFGGSGGGCGFKVPWHRCISGASITGQQPGGGGRCCQCCSAKSSIGSICRDRLVAGRAR